MYCPSCRTEYRAGQERCLDCRVPLVDELEAEGRTDEEGGWTLLGIVSTEIEATLIQGYLESAGIPCSIESLVFHAEPVNLGALARVRLHVLAEHLDEARELLASRDDLPEAVSPPTPG